jgi:alpha-mannosidase
MSIPESIDACLARLRQLSQVDLQHQWRWDAADWAIAEAMEHLITQPDRWSIAIPNQKGHIAWPAGQKVLWLQQIYTIPDHLNGYALSGLRLRLALTWWAEQAEIFVNGQQVQTGDLFDCVTRVPLRAAVQPGEAIALAIRLVSPIHDAGALVKSQLVFESGDFPWNEPGFVADEWAVVQQFLTTFQPEALADFAQILTQLDWGLLDSGDLLAQRGAFNDALNKVRQQLAWSEEIKQRHLVMVGHAHLDLAWLWPVAETWQAAERTFESVLNLQKAFPELIFAHSTPALYAWIEAHRPELFAAIQAQVQAGKWEIIAGLWVEPDLNLIAGESIVRHLLYGQQYVQAKFGAISAIAWLPDTFGFCWQLPQLFKLAGIEYFATQKLRWNDTTQFPHEIFWWRSPDGSQLLSIMLPPIGTQIDPVQMANYAWEWERQTGCKTAFWLPGIGDHGGGPTQDMLETARRWQRSPLFPQLDFKSAKQYFQELQLELTQPQDQLPIWNDELYLEFHRGCYTSHADQKQFNRQCEQELYRAELWSAIATLVTGAVYPQQDLEIAWKQVLFNQFHDILPGSSIPEVFEEANQAWIEAIATSSKLTDQALSHLSQTIDLQPPHHSQKFRSCYPLLVFNALNWVRSQAVCVPLPAVDLKSGQIWQVLDGSGSPVISQIKTDETHRLEAGLHFLAEAIPAIGYRVFWLCQVESVNTASLSVPALAEFTLENEVLKVTVDSATGYLSRVFDKVNQREVLSGLGNALQVFQDQGQYWDAWNIDPNYAQHPLETGKLKHIAWQQHGPLVQQILASRSLFGAELNFSYRLEAGSPLLKISVNILNWQEPHVLLKVAFPLTIAAELATTETACGAIARPTRPQTATEKAKWEVPALKWADLSDDHYGVSLINTCKQGYDYSPNQIRLTLLRCTTWPDPHADRGNHQFSYALYPHAGDWHTAQTVQHAHSFNEPIQFRVVNERSNSQPSLSHTGQFLDLGADNLVLMCFKRSELHPEAWSLRCYESAGEAAILNFTNSLGLEIWHPVDLLERPTSTPTQNQDGSYALTPWQIVSFRLSSTANPERSPSSDPAL